MSLTLDSASTRKSHSPDFLARYESALHISLKFVPFLAVILASNLLRFKGVTQNGIIGSDTFQYWDIALMWSQGQFVLNNDLNEHIQFFRPTFYLLNLLSLKLFGLHDYSLRALIGVFESINVLLVFAIGLAVLKRPWSALLLTLVYSLTPSTILLSQIELPHTYSATFILLMYLSYQLGIKPPGEQAGLGSLPFLMLSGFFGGCAATTHGSTTFFGPIMIAVILADHCSRGIHPLKNWFRSLTASCACFTVCFFIPYLIGGGLVGYSYMIRAISSEAELRSGSGIGPVQLIYTFLSDGPRKSLSPLIAILFYFSTAYLAWISIVRRSLKVALIMPTLLILMYSLFFALTFRDLFYPRLFLPLNTFVILSIFLAFSELFKPAGRIGSEFLLTLVALPMVYYTFSPEASSVLAYYRGHSKGAPRAIYDVIGRDVGPDARLLVTPYLQWYHRPQFRAAPYFGGNVDYLMDCAAGDIGSFIESRKIKWVFVSKELDPNISAHPGERYKNLGACSNMSVSNYDLQLDLKTINDLLVAKGARKLEMQTSSYGELYELGSPILGQANGS